jgi:pimeloyl-ACP methyl ester carboxylesterase
MKKVWRGVAALLLLVLVAGLIFWRYPLWVNDQILRVRLWRSGVKSDYMQVGQYRLHYFEAKPEDGREGVPLLLVHGLGARGEDWAPMIPALGAAGFHVYVPDLLGYGRSPQPDVSYSIAMEEQTVVDFMNAVGWKHADVGGWSMGGWISMKMALDHPEMVDRLVLYDSAGVYFDAAKVADLFTPNDTAEVRQLLAVLTPKPPDMPEFVAQAMLRKLQGNRWVIRRSLGEMLVGKDLMDFRLHGIQQPTLVVWGDKDAVIPLDAGRRIHEAIPGSRLDVVEGCGHLLPAECSKAALDGTEEFLMAEPPMRGGERMVAASGK